MDVHQELKRRRAELVRMQAENNLLETQARQSEEKALKAAEELGLASESLVFLEELANSRRGAMKGKIETVLSEALALVYGPGRKVELAYGVKNNRSHLSFEVVKDSSSGEVRRRIDGTGCGLGVSDVVSVPLRLLVMLGSKQTDRVCVLDECYKHVNPEKVPLVAEFLKTLCVRLGVQIILLSHHEGLRKKVDVAFEVSIDENGESSVEKFC
jgi:DNA repair exonuclease SbcCD ATPase subunit